MVIGRYTYDMPHWKGYKGGTRGVIWSGKLNGKFNKIVDLDGHVSSPCIHGEKVFFVSDHEGSGQIYSVDIKGGKLTKHSDFKTYYPRHLSSNGEVLLYSMGGELFTLNPEKACCQQPCLIEHLLPLFQRFYPYFQIFEMDFLFLVKTTHHFLRNLCL